MNYGRWLLGLGVFACLGGAAACGGELPVEPTGGAGGGGAGTGGSTGTSGLCPGSDETGCTVVLAPSTDDTGAVQTALIEAQSNDTVCMCPGTYSFQNRLSLTVPGVTLKGIGASREEVVLDFAGQLAGDDGLTVTSDGFTIENMWVKNTPGNGVVVSGADSPTFRNLKVSWDAGSVLENGAYAVYPVKCSKVLIEDCEVIGASDAGVYVGQSEQIIVRNNTVYGNVAGIEIENSDLAEVYGNESYDNTAGVLVFVLPNLEKTDGNTTSVHSNNVHDNNRANFGDPNTTVGRVPAGTGVLVLAADDTEIRDNQITNNQTMAIIVVSFDTLELLLGTMIDDPTTDGFPEGLYIHGNTYTNNGTMPVPPISAIGVNPIENVIWDGVEVMPGSADICLSATPTSFRNLSGAASLFNAADDITDPAAHTCEGTTQPPVTL